MLFGNQILSFVSRLGARSMVATSVIAMILLVAGCSKSDNGSTAVVTNDSNKVASNNTNADDTSTDMMPSDGDTMMMPSEDGSGSGDGTDTTSTPFPSDDETGSGDTTDTTGTTPLPGGTTDTTDTGTTPLPGSGFDGANPGGDTTTTDTTNLTGGTTIPGDTTNPAGDTTDTTTPTGDTTTTTGALPGAGNGNGAGNAPTTTNPGNLGGEGLGATTTTGPTGRQGAAPAAPRASNPLHPAFHVIMALNKGEVTGLSKYISSRARGTLGTLRTGKVSAKQIADYQAAFAKPSSPKTKSKSGETTITIPSGDFTITMRVKKERTSYVLTSLSYRKKK